MKKLFLMLTIFIMSEFCFLLVSAQYEPSTQIGLPEGAITRLGKGNIENIMYSPDGTWFVVTANIDIWIYINSVAFSPDSKAIATGHNDGTVLLWDILQR